MACDSTLKTWPVTALLGKRQKEASAGRVELGDGHDRTGRYRSPGLKQFMARRQM